MRELPPADCCARRSSGDVRDYDDDVDGGVDGDVADGGVTAISARRMQSGSGSAAPLALSSTDYHGLTRPSSAGCPTYRPENTMMIAFHARGVAMTLWLFTRSNPTAFVLMSGVVLFAWGEIFSLFPSTLTDTYGAKHATTNYGFLYMAQGIGSVLGGPVAALIHDAYGSWMPVFAIIIAMNFATALLAGVALKPMRRRWLGAISAREGWRRKTEVLRTNLRI